MNSWARTSRVQFCSALKNQFQLRFFQLPTSLSRLSKTPDITPAKRPTQTHRAAERESALDDANHLAVDEQHRAGQSAGGHLTSKNALVRVTSMTSSQQGAVRRFWSNSSLQHLNGGARVAAWLESVSHRFDRFQCQHGKSHGKTN